MRIKTKFVLPVILAFWAALWISPSHAQVLTGTIVGQVVDASGAVVPDAKVKITHRETNESRESVTNAAGDYSFPSLPGGVYDAVISKSGFTTFTARGIAVTVGQVARVADANLRVGQVSETVSVSAQAAVLQTDRAEVRT